MQIIIAHHVPSHTTQTQMLQLTAKNALTHLPRWALGGQILVTVKEVMNSVLEALAMSVELAR